MPITQQQIRSAQAVQMNAAHDESHQVRLVAGPGTGKSFCIEERVRWLLARGIRAGSIAVVSFTRASSVELRLRIHAYCSSRNQPNGADVRVTTLHSLALRLMRSAGLLHYPSDPLVLDQWELENIFDAEFGHSHDIGKKRREDIRRDHEAFWSTGQWNPANYIPPSPPITSAERTCFNGFHGPRTQAYSCVLPGEIVRECLNQIVAGNLDPIRLARLEHLIVDEYQDLNPIDQQFIDEMIARGAVPFVAGDDDQSIYSFRYASPGGIQDFTVRHRAAASHTLSHCFRCSHAIASVANALITAYPSQSRIAKTLSSLYARAVPPVEGTIHRWRFNSALAEARAIATSCQGLITDGLDPREILILLSNQRELLPGLCDQLDRVNVAFEPPRAETFIDSTTGRFVLAIVRIVCGSDDYVAHRLLLGLRAGVGIGMCDAVASAVIEHGLNYKGVFYNPVPAGVFRGRTLTAINHTRRICAQISTWQSTDTLLQRHDEIEAILQSSFGTAEAQNWRAFADSLPSVSTLGELRDFLWADTSQQRAGILQSAFERLRQPVPTCAVEPARIRIMSMHGAKGLSAQVVFIPGMEDEIFPGPWRQPYPGLVLEAARLLYVSVTRARAACILSCATSRVVHGRTVRMPPSRFTTSLNGPFVHRAVGLQACELHQIMTDIGNL